MHAWAAISHSIDYKRQTDVPADLRKSFNALSALFYVADTQFEEFARQTEKSKEQAEEFVSRSNPLEKVPLDFDTLQALAGRIFPDRSTPRPEIVSGLLAELLACGISDANDLSQFLVYRPDLLESYEKERAALQGFPHRRRLNQVGAIRAALRLFSKRYRQSFPYNSNTVTEYLDDFRRRAGLIDLDNDFRKPDRSLSS